MIKRLTNIGPGVLVTAAFIGPGTVTACTLAGANYGFALLWALLFATIATIVLQEMSARLGTISGKGLGAVLHQSLETSPWRWPLTVLIILALFGSNAAYEAGNLAGAALGIEAITSHNTMIFKASVLVLSVFAAIILFAGSYRQIEKFLIGLVLIMGLAFVLTFFAVKPALSPMLSGLFVPKIPDGSLLTVIALIGTTVVPYNLFLHASAAKNRWQGERDLASARADTVLSIGLGGIIAILVASTAAASIFAQGLSVTNAADMAVQFEPLFGSFSKYLLGVGLFAAGLSSTITAPLATSYALSEILNISDQRRVLVSRIISLSILVIGAVLSLTGIKPIQLIILAQFANGLLLPVMAGFLIYALNQRQLLGKYTNGWAANLAGCCVLVLTAGLGLRLIARSLGAI